MGNRAAISFSNDQHSNTEPGLYLHWNGGPESVLAFLEAARQLGVRDGSDKTYFFARLCQIVGNFFGGSLSVGINTLARSDCDNYDNGLYVINDDLTIKERVFSRGRTAKTVGELDGCDQERYEGILAEILEKNRPFFEKG